MLMMDVDDCSLADSQPCLAGLCWQPPDARAAFIR